MSNKSMTVDPDLAKAYLTGLKLNNHIIGFQPRRKYFAEYPEHRTLYGLENVIVCDLTIQYDYNGFSRKDLSWEIEGTTWAPISGFHWHFRRCIFKDLSSISHLSFLWANNFRFESCEFDFKTNPEARNIALCFSIGSNVRFSHNDFGEARLQIQCAADSKTETLASISFLGNSHLRGLDFVCRAIHYQFRESNEVSRLVFSDTEEEFAVDLGAFERIDRRFLEPEHHRRLFLMMRTKATRREDKQIERVLDSYIEEIDYHLLRIHRVREKWLEYSQTRTLAFLRK